MRKAPAGDAQQMRRARAGRTRATCGPPKGSPGSQLGHGPRHRWPWRGSGKGRICVLESFVVEMAGAVSSAAPQPCSPAWAAASRAATPCSHPLFSPSSFIKTFRPKCPGSVSFLSSLRTRKEGRNLLTAQPEETEPPCPETLLRRRQDAAEVWGGSAGSPPLPARPQA